MGIVERNFIYQTLFPLIFNLFFEFHCKSGNISRNILKFLKSIFHINVDYEALTITYANGERCSLKRKGT